MSGVKNLRAMFEQKGDTSPPDRGRSPGIPWTPSPVSESPRPLSKVRTNFIAIEKDGRIGLQREASQDSIISTTRKLSGGSDVPTPPAIREDSDVFGGSMAAQKTSLKDQPIPESPRTDIGTSVTTGLPKNTVEPKSQAPSAAAATARLKKFGLDNAADDRQPTSNGSDSNGDSHGSYFPTTKHLNGNDHGKGKDKAPNKEVEKVQAKSTPKASPKHLAIPSGIAVAKPARSPTTSRIPKTPTEMTASKLPTKTPDKVVRQTEKAPELRASATSSKAAGLSSSSIKRPPPLQASTLQLGVGFVKPKPKSPTRPVKLPASLTTHTAASGSKSRQSLSRASGGINNAESLGRSPSRGSVSTTATSSVRLGAVKSLKRQNSTINRPRPSLGPPPKQPARDHPPTKKEKEVDEGFLARMTRPTQAFASKAVGKVVSPPRRVSAAPAARKPVTKSESQTSHGSSSRIPSRPKVSPAPPSAGHSSAGSSRQPRTAPAEQIPIRVEQADTAEEAVEVTESVEDNVAVPEDLAPEGSEPNTTAQEIAPVVEQVETAEEAVQIAKEVEGDVSLPESPQVQNEAEDPKEETVEPVHASEELDLEEPAPRSITELNHQINGTAADASDVPEKGN